MADRSRNGAHRKVILSLLPKKELIRVSEADIEAHYPEDREGAGE